MHGGTKRVVAVTHIFFFFHNMKEPEMGAKKKMNTCNICDGHGHGMALLCEDFCIYGPIFIFKGWVIYFFVF